jgi:hypothetical protein
MFAAGPRPAPFGELTHAYSRRLEQTLNGSAKLTWAMSGRDPMAAEVRELECDVIAWRWDEARGEDVPYFRGLIAQSEDSVSEQAHTVTFTAHDYFDMLNRRMLTAPATFTTGTGVGQDTLVNWLLSHANDVWDGSNTVHMVPGSAVPLHAGFAAGDGTMRTMDAGGVPMRMRGYLAGALIGTLIDELAHVIGGFDYDVAPATRTETPTTPNDGYDALRIFWPQQGITRTDPILEYGSTVSAFTRSVNSADYSNYWRTIGAAPPGAAADAPPMWSERWNADANDVTRVPVGLWMSVDNASDVSIQGTLDEMAGGNLDLYGVLIPTYSVSLRPGAYREALVNMGDVVPLVIAAGRLDVTDAVRIVGMAFAIGDDGDEDVELTVGRAPVGLVDMWDAARRDVAALARR